METTDKTKESTTPADDEPKHEETPSEAPDPVEKTAEDHPELSLDELADLKEREAKEGEVQPPETKEGESPPQEPTEEKGKPDERTLKLKIDGEEREYPESTVITMAQQSVNWQRQHEGIKPLLDVTRQHGFNTQETAQMTGLGARVTQVNAHALQQGVQQGSPEHGAALLAALGYRPQAPRQQPQQPQMQPGQQPQQDQGTYLDLFPELGGELQQLRSELGQLGGHIRSEAQVRQQAVYQRFMQDMAQGINAADAALNEAEKSYGVKLDDPLRVEYSNYARRVAGGDPSQLANPNLIRSFMAFRFPDAQARVAGQGVAAEELQRRKDAAQAAVSGSAAPSGIQPKKSDSAWEPDEYTRIAERRSTAR